MMQASNKLQSPLNVQSLRDLFDVEQQVPVLNGSLKSYINFDNAASTLPLRIVTDTVNKGLKISSLYSQLALFYEEERKIIGHESD